MKNILFYFKNIKNQILEKSIYKNSFGSVVVKISHLLLSFLVGLVLARILGADEYGIYVYAISLISILSIPTQLGIPKLLVRYVSRYSGDNNWSKLKGIISWSNSIVLSISVLIMLIIILYSYFGNIALQKSKVLFWGSFLIPILSINALRAAILRGLRYVIHGLVPDLVVLKLVLILLTLSTYYFFHIEINSIVTMQYHVLSGVIALTLGSWWLWKKLPQQVLESSVDTETKKWISVTIPFLLTGGMAIIINKIDIVMIEWFKSSSEVGIYDISVKISLFVPFSLSAINMAVGPFISKLYNQNNGKELQKIITFAVTASVLLSTPLVLIFITFGEEILYTIFGPEFAYGYISLLILTLSQFINVACGPVGLYLDMTNYEKIVLISMSSAAILNIILNIILIPNHGIEGAAIASLISTLVWNLSLVSFSIYKTGVNTTIFSLYKIFINR